MEDANIVPLVPKLIVRLPSSTQPVPIAAIILSPPPVATRVSLLKPNRSAISSFTHPIIPGLTIFGSLSISDGEIILHSSIFHVPSLIVIKPVPEASPFSITAMPVR